MSSRVSYGLSDRGLMTYEGEGEDSEETGTLGGD